MSRAIDDPAKLARAGRVMRAAVDREARLRKVSSDDFLKRVVAQAPPLTAAQKADLAALLAPGGEAERRREEDLAAQAKAEEDRRRASVRKGIAAKKTPQALAEEYIAERLAAMRAPTTAADPAVAIALDLMQKTGQSWTDAHADAETILEVRRLDAERRRTHANGHFWCVFPECPDADQDPDDVAVLREDG